MIWRKLGRLLCADNQFPWMKTYTTNPVARLSLIIREIDICYTMEMAMAGPGLA